MEMTKLRTSSFMLSAVGLCPLNRLLAFNFSAETSVEQSPFFLSELDGLCGC